MSLQLITFHPELELQPLDKSLLKQCFIDWYRANVKGTGQRGGSECQHALQKSKNDIPSGLYRLKVRFMSGFEQSGLAEESA